MTEVAYVAADRTMATAGDPDAVLLAGPPADGGAATLAGHQDLWGALPTDRTAILTAIEESDLLGRGGGQFPAARKIRSVREAVARSGHRPVVVVNASESEPASCKDDMLVRLRPHLVLDGAVIAARAVGATEVIIRLHGGRPGQRRSLQHALSERFRARLPDPMFRVSVGPDRYVAGESSAVIRALEGGVAVPRSGGAPIAHSGVHGRPTLLHNAETVAQMAVISRWGARRWHTAGPGRTEGPTLLTLHGAVADPGLVVEVTGPATIGQVLWEFAGWNRPPQAVLVGGYAGNWLPGHQIWHLPVSRSSLSAAGAPLGCGLLACLPENACPIRETARVVSWLAGQSAGQCGPCVLGLPSLAEVLGRLAAGRPRRRDRDRLRSLLYSVRGRGGCRHPDGVANLVISMLAAFQPDVARHAARQPCRDAEVPSCLPLPRQHGS